jgi:hypothetical protein
MRFSSASRRSQPPSQRRREVVPGKNAGHGAYDELVLQWTMSATTLSASSRSDLLALVAENRKCAAPLISTTLESQPDELVEEMERCVCVLRNDHDLGFRAAHEMRRLEAESVSLLSRDVKLELCYLQESESMFQVKSVWEELQQQAQCWCGLEILEEASWQPSARSDASICSYVGYGIRNVVYVRVHDVITLDPAGRVQLIARTMLFHPDDAARGRNARWSPHFGTLLKAQGLVAQ